MLHQHKFIFPFQPSSWLCYSCLKTSEGLICLISEFVIFLWFLRPFLDSYAFTSLFKLCAGAFWNCTTLNGAWIMLLNDQHSDLNLLKLITDLNVYLVSDRTWISKIWNTKVALCVWKGTIHTSWHDTWYCPFQHLLTVKILFLSSCFFFFCVFPNWCCMFESPTSLKKEEAYFSSLSHLLDDMVLKVFGVIWESLTCSLNNT